MACTVMLELNVKPECVDQVKEGLKGILPDTRSYDGCLGVYAVQNQDDANTLVAVEEWESRAKYEAYLAWRTERGDLEPLVAMLAGEPSIRYFDKFDG